jgi:hypothetical protein
MDQDSSEEDRQHEIIWRKLFDETELLLKDFAHQGLIGSDDYWLVDEDWGWDVLQIELPLSLAWPPIAKKLQLILARYADWRITIRLADRPEGWPGMGIVISQDKIIDDLKREYFPAEFRSITFDE